ncbi:actin-like protein Arp5p [Cyathus striatus]|nr:actin-like protein Arp5p [Cyathus striatus]
MSLPAAPDDQSITRIPIPQLPVIPPSPHNYDPYRATDVPIVIDNGSSTLRWGWASSLLPYTGPNVIAKYKERRTNKPLLLFGEGIDAESGARGQAKYPWEGDVLLNFDAFENALDYAFLRLGIDTPTVAHPVLMTERLCTPLHSRALTSELMFELYSVPSLAYCIDGVMSFYHNNNDSYPASSDGLVLSFNTASTSVIPMLEGKGILSQSKRIPLGASQASEYLLKLIQLKYPNFPTRVTPMQTNWMLHNFCEFATDYTSLLRELKDPLKMRSAERIIQFPFALPVQEEKSEEELARIAEKRKEQGRKLQELAAKSRMEKLVRKEQDLQYLVNLREGKGTENKREWMHKLQSEGFDDEAGLDAMVKKLEADLKKARKKEAGEAILKNRRSLQQLKEKKKQKLLKAGWEARARARKEKEREREEREQQEKKEEEERETDLGGWARKLRQEQESLMSRIKERARRKAALSDRKSAAAQARMKSIANLAADDRVPKKKRKGGGEDTFGADDADWAIYRKINTAVESSDEEEDINQLQLVEQKLLQHDPTFTLQNTLASLNSQRSALLSAFKPRYEEGDVEGNTRIHLNTERWRVCEAYFSPGMAGVDSAGIGEVIQNILSEFTFAERGRLVNNIFLTGSPSQFPNLSDRLQATLRPILPPEMPINIVRAADPSLDAWKGMAAFSAKPELKQVSVTREEYEEYGGERIKKWWGGNWNGGFIPS